MERAHLVEEHQFLLQRSSQFYEQYTILQKQVKPYFIFLTCLQHMSEEEARQAEILAHKNKVTSLTEFYELQVKHLQQQLKEAQAIWKVAILPHVIFNFTSNRCTKLYNFQRDITTKKCSY
jgi:hypothetical protein